jgi:GAF domain-containing protein
MNRISNETAISRLNDFLARGEVRPAVAFLNSLTPHRFTSLFRFDESTLRNLVFYDREQPEVRTCKDISVLSSYCVFVRDTNAAFAIANAREDDRLGNHPKRQEVQSYCGVPLVNREGKMYGTACHFDFKPGGVAARDVELLECLARLLPEFTELRPPVLEVGV